MKKAKLYIVGLKDPIELEPEEAKVAQDLIADFTADPMTPFSIEGIWTGKKRDMKYVLFDDDKSVRYNRDIMMMTDSEAKIFEREIAPYASMSKQKFKKPMYAREFWLRALGLIKLEFHERVTDDKKKHYTLFIKAVNGNRLPEYDAATRKYERYSAWRSRNDYVEGKKVEGLEKLAKGMRV